MAATATSMSQPDDGRNPENPRLAARGWLPWTVGLAIVLITAISLSIDHAIAYDPEAWIVWSREITGPGVFSMHSGPTWKPLAMVFIVPFTLVSRGEPDVYYWLAVSRAFALLGVVGIAVEANRLAGKSAALLAALLVVVSPWWYYNAVLGNIEPMLVGVLFLALCAHRRGWATLCGVLLWAVGLARPEALPFAALYAAWIAWQRRGSQRSLVAIGAVAVALLVLAAVIWDAPHLSGAGASPVASATAAASEGSARNSSIPFLTVFKDAYVQLTAIPAVLAACGLMTAAWRARVSYRLSRARGLGRRAQGLWEALSLELVLGLCALGFVLIIAVMAQAGCAGTRGYMIPALAVFDLLAAVSGIRIAGWAAMLHIPRWLRTGVVVVAVTVVALFAALTTLRGQRTDIDDHTTAARLMRTQLATLKCPGHVWTYEANNTTLAQITGQSIWESTMPRDVHARPPTFVVCAERA